MNLIDAFGTAASQTIEEIKKTIELAQRIRDILRVAQSGKGCACLDTATAGTCQCALNALIVNDPVEMAHCFCLSNPDPKCEERARKTTDAIVKAKKILEKAKEEYEKRKKD